MSNSKPWLVSTLSLCTLLILAMGNIDSEQQSDLAQARVKSAYHPKKEPLFTRVFLQADADIIPKSDELVTFGLPIRQGQVRELNAIKVTIDGVEVPIHVEAGLLWHWADQSIRSATIQLDKVDMTKGNVELVISNQGRDTSKDRAAKAITRGWTTAKPEKAGMPYPRIFALHDTQYLAESGLIPPYLPMPAGIDKFGELQLGQFKQWSGELNYQKSRAANWLFDRSSAYFKVYMTTGRVEFLKEAFLSKQFYFTHVRRDNAPPSKSGGRGCWAWENVSCADGKYIAPQQAKLAWALAGDNTQWDIDLINDMALQSDLGWNQYSSRDKFDGENEGFTERAAGLTGLAELTAFEMTADSTVRAHLTQRIASLADMQQSEKTWDKLYGWTPKSGGFDHNVDVHEGNLNEKNAPLGDSNSRAFSPWMSENIADFLWQSYWITQDKKIPEMLRRLGDAIDRYGFTKNYDSDSGEYVYRPEFLGVKDVRVKSCNKSKSSTELLYFGSKWADAKTLKSYDFRPYYTDTHNIETVLPLATAYYFESSPTTRQRLQLRIESLISGWAHADCARVFEGVYRLFNWQHRSNSVRTWQWVLKTTGGKSASIRSSQPVSATGVVATKITILSKRAETLAELPSSKNMVNLKGWSSSMFTDVTAAVIDVGPLAHQPFWIGMPDVNGDGCLDLFVGTHNDNAGDSQMWLHTVIDGKCQNRFVHYGNDKGRYSQRTRGRITSRYVFSNITGNPSGLPDFFGSDADGGNAVIYPLHPGTVVGGQPSYISEIVGCRGGKARCTALDMNGDGNIELVAVSSVGMPRRRVYSPINDRTIVPTILEGEPGFDATGYLVVDIDDDSWPDIVAGESLGYWRYNPNRETLDDFVVAFGEAKENFSRDDRRATSNMQVPIDFDNDGDFDILFGSGKWGPGKRKNEYYLSLHRNNGDGTFTDVTQRAGGGSWTDGSLKNETYWTTYAGIYPGDFDNDGYTDFMTMTQSYRDSPRMYKNNGDGTFTQYKDLIKNGGAGVDVFRPWGNVGDWNNDGFLDVAILSDGIGAVEGLRLYSNNGNANHWLKMRARGLGNNTDGYHTKFIVRDAMSKHILATRYLGNYNPADTRFVAHAGLGRSDRVDLQVEFPHGGPTYLYSDLVVDQEVVVFRDGCLLAHWQPGQGWPTSSHEQQCVVPEDLSGLVTP